MGIAFFGVKIILLNKSSQHVKSKLRTIRVTSGRLTGGIRRQRLVKARAAPRTAANRPPAPWIYINARLLPLLVGQLLLPLPQPKERHLFAFLLLRVRGLFSVFPIGTAASFSSSYTVIGSCPPLFIRHQNTIGATGCAMEKS